MTTDAPPWNVSARSPDQLSAELKEEAPRHNPVTIGKKEKGSHRCKPLKIWLRGAATGPVYTCTQTGITDR